MKATKPKPELWIDLTIHPAAQILPMPSETEIIGLTESIKKFGLFVPIDMYVDDRKDPDAKPVLIDGRGRLEALKRLGDPRTPPL